MPLTASLIQGLQILYRVRHLRWNQKAYNRGLKHNHHSLTHHLPLSIKFIRTPTVFDALVVLTSKQQAQSSFNQASNA
jgi:hypothetical protein